MEDNELEPPVEIVCYALVKKPPPVTTSKRAAKLKDNEKYAKRAPFQFTSADLYLAFLIKLAAVLPCPVLNIIQSQLTWKPQSPNRPPLLLSGETGYKAMIQTFVEGKKNRIVMLMMPPPTKPVIENMV